MSSDEESPLRVAIGISFGNSYSSIACTIASDAKVIANEDGDRQIPSILSYSNGEEYHGSQAKALLIRNPKNTITSFRDFLGKKYVDLYPFIPSDTVDKNIKFADMTSRFEMIDPTPCHSSAHPQEYEDTVAFSIKDTEDDSSNTVTVSEITTRHLRRLKHSASDYLGKQVNAAVITVPTDFTDAQKASLLEAAKNAGLDVLQLISEPIAALLAYDRVEKPADKIVVVADLGGTRSDVAVVSTKGGMYSILATAHDYFLGGAQLDEVLMEYFAKEFIKKHRTDPRENERALAKLKFESEATKKALSLGTTAAFNAESLVDSTDFASSINRSRYELLASKVFARFTRLIENAVEKAELDVLDIDEILLAGGTSHTPRIATNLQSNFPPPTRVIAPLASSSFLNPSELSVRGASLQAFLIEGFDQDDIEQSTHPMVTVTPHLAQTLGLVVMSASGVEDFKPVILAETPLPVRRTVTFINAAKGEGVLLRLCEGYRDTKVTRAAPKWKTNGTTDEDSDVDSDGEEVDVKERVWKIGNPQGELSLRGVKTGAKVTVQINVALDLELSLSAMEVGGGRAGVRGTITGTGAAMNGKAH